MRAVWPQPSPADPQLGSTAGVSEVSRFSCMKFLGVPWGLRPRRTEQKLALSLLFMLPSAHVNRVGVRVVCFRGSMATPPILYLRFAGSLAVAAQDSRPKVDRYSFLVRLFHPLLHAGLSRRTNIPIALIERLAGLAGAVPRSEAEVFEVGLEATAKRKSKHLQSTDGDKSTRKALVVHVN